MAETEYLQGPYSEMSTIPLTARSERIWNKYRWPIIICLGIILLVIVLLIIYLPAATKVASSQRTPLTRFSLPISERRSPWRKHDNFRLDKTTVNRCIESARNSLQKRQHFEQQLAENTKNLPKSAASYHQQVTTMSSEFKAITQSAILAEMSLKHLLDSNISMQSLKDADMNALLDEWPHCQLPIKKECPLSGIYRSLDATCNNFKTPVWGSILQPFRRILPPVYGDQYSAPRSASINKDRLLLSPRTISLRFQNVTPVANEKKLSMLFLQWGQFLDHDLTATAATKGVNGSSIRCCGQQELHPECFPITVDENDEFYSDKAINCMDFVRSAPAPQCQIDDREQMNQATAFIDGSMIYGTTHLEGNVRLRVKQNGYLRSRLFSDGRWLLPISLDPLDGCNRPDYINKSRYCFKSGDERTNEQIGLTSMHTVWMREHNRVASHLVDLNKDWSDEKLYEESRRIVIAKIQHITYNEFLPLILGKELMQQAKLNILATGYDESYDHDINAGISNEFATAAFRFGHSMLQGLVLMEGPRGRNIDFMQLHKLMFNPFALYDFGKIDAILRGSATQNPRTMDTGFAAQVVNHLFQNEQSSHGVDLFAINIQRGRDHGLAPYVQWRQICNLDEITNWDQLESEMRPTSFSAIKALYSNVKDIDLYVGILAELPMDDGLLGAVGSCIIADQFVRLKRGDRFWYETSDPVLRFTPEQLAEIRKSSLARMLCDNGDAMDFIQPRAMESVGPGNERLPCSSNQIPTTDLNQWEDEDSVVVDAII